jgi:hypothetical protein
MMYPSVRHLDGVHVVLKGVTNFRYSLAEWQLEQLLSLPVQVAHTVRLHCFIYPTDQCM